MGLLSFLGPITKYDPIESFSRKIDPTGKALGVYDGMDPQVMNPPSPPTAPTMGNSQEALDEADQEMARRLARGRTSTMLSGGAGFSDAGNTSKILLGQ